MSKLLSQGGFGCNFYPSTKRIEQNTINTPVITKIQLKGFTSNNHKYIGNIIRKVKGYDLYFIPVLSDSSIDIRESTNNDLVKCDIINGMNKEYVASQLKYYKSIDLITLLKRQTDKEVILTLTDTYSYLLQALSKLQYINVVHFDINLDNIVFIDDTWTPRIIEFGLSIPIPILTKENIKKYFYAYSANKYAWALEIHIINYILHCTSVNLTNADATTIVDAYITHNKHIHVLPEHYESEFKSSCVIQINKFVGMDRQRVLDLLLQYYYTWDTYSLSIVYLRLMHRLFIKSNSTFIPLFNELLLININPNPEIRLSIIDTRNKFNEVFYNNMNIKEYQILSHSLVVD